MSNSRFFDVYGGVSVTRLPLAGRIYVCLGIALGCAVMASSVPSLAFPRPGLFAALLLLNGWHPHAPHKRAGERAAEVVSALTAPATAD